MCFSAKDGHGGMDNDFHGTSEEIRRAHEKKVGAAQHPSDEASDIALDRLIDVATNELRAEKGKLVAQPCPHCHNLTMARCGGTIACFGCSKLLDGWMGIAV